MRIEQRLERLEKENRDLRRLMSALVAGALGTALIALVGGSLPGMVALTVTTGLVLLLTELRRGSVRGIIRAQKIEIIGDDGVTRVALGETVDGAGAVATYDAQGKLIAALDSSRRGGPTRPATVERGHQRHESVGPSSTVRILR